ncbi:MAG: hypothetical protein B6226_04000 [Candidatus Cloacimonetes bacterium 4572_65]|nr:MAG: hypothetical protein B6226_04000 [Candidatus Cloacimonetes bacterium 4572_65]
MKKDYHIHSLQSPDSSLNPVELIKKAIKLNYETIAFTDHYEPTDPDESFHSALSFIEYLNYFHKLRDTYKDKINILAGVEIGEYHLAKSAVEDYFQGYRADVILGSVHVLEPKRYISMPFKPLLNQKEITAYYKSNLKLVEECDIDILAHLGIFMRYDNHNITHVKPIIRDIFQVMIEKKIALEINYSGLRKSTRSIIPQISTVEQYATEGGSLISIGSDTHIIDHFDDHYDEAVKILDMIGWNYRLFETNIHQN